VADLATERAAFLAGFGDGPALIAALRDATLVVPLDVDGKFFTLVWSGLPWMVAFTDPQSCARFASAANRDLDAIEVCQLRGATVIDDLLDRAPTPTGLVIDAADPGVLVFPPVANLTPHRYVDERTGQVVMA
jgi:hypothetical protein